MCGIAGLLLRRAELDERRLGQLLEAISRPMTSRGPDGDDTWTDADAGIGFGHRRLAVVDLSEHGDQPMISLDGRYVLTYNGEIYNHRELSAQLAAEGVRFEGHSDSRVLIEGIAQWGLAAMLDRVDGMFAFGLWDRAERALTLVRDRLGEKPLFYGQVGNGDLLFASSLDSFRVHPAFDGRIDRDALTLFLRHKYVPAPRSIYAGVRKLEPGSSVVFRTSTDEPEPVEYWSVFDQLASRERFAGSPDEAADELDRLLAVSIGRRMIADVPVGAFLSGGIDSSTIVAVAQEISTTPVRTFTIGSTNAQFDESDHAREVARHLGTDHTELIVTDDDVMAAIGTLAASHDEPFADASQIPTRLVSEMARSEVTVALSGDAGDELFGGYNRYLWVPRIWSRLRRVPDPLRRAVMPVADRIPPRVWDRAARVIPERRRPRQLGAKMTKVIGIADASTPEEVFHRLTSHWPDPSSLARTGPEPPTIHTDPSRWPPTGDVVDHMMAIDLVTYLPDDILAKVDRAAMSVSLETRVPFLDRSIVELALSLPTGHKIRDGVGKWPVRNVLARRVPNALIDRPKTGFATPIGDWLRGPLKPWASDLLFDGVVAASLDQEMIRRTWDEHQRGAFDHSDRLWDVLMLGDWCRHREVAAL